MKRSHWIGFAIAVGIVLVFTWEGFQSRPPRSSPPTLQNEPDFYMEGADITQFDELGALRYRMRARRVAHYPSRNVTELDAPHLTFFEHQPTPWEVSSERGTIHHENRPEGGTREVVELNDHVRLERHASPGNFIEVTMQALTLYPQRKYAETDEAVMIQSHTGRTTANGLRADLEAGMLTLHSGVHTVVLPQTL
ncbi:MAG: LPS export ABC transporter periplasmic protein LptC [Gammaproteobacteria bacterium]|jgi:lipopolysaccharide export system protein LptC